MAGAALRERFGERDNMFAAARIADGGEGCQQAARLLGVYRLEALQSFDQTIGHGSVLEFVWWPDVNDLSQKGAAVLGRNLGHSLGLDGARHPALGRLL